MFPKTFGVRAFLDGTSLDHSSVPSLSASLPTSSSSARTLNSTSSSAISSSSGSLTFETKITSPHNAYPPSTSTESMASISLSSATELTKSETAKEMSTIVSPSPSITKPPNAAAFGGVDDHQVQGTPTSSKGSRYYYNKANIPYNICPYATDADYSTWCAISVGTVKLHFWPTGAATLNHNLRARPGKHFSLIVRGNYE